MMVGFVSKIRQLVPDRRPVQSSSPPRPPVKGLRREEAKDEQIICMETDSRDMYGFPIGSPSLVREYFQVLGNRLETMRKQSEKLEALMFDKKFALLDHDKKRLSARKYITAFIRNGT
jgi:hypothetical protein